MAKIIINGRFLFHIVTGVERYAHEIIKELDKIVEPGNVIMAVPAEVKSIPQYRNIKVISVGKLHNRAWEHISFPRYVKKNNAISLNLCNVAPISDPGIVCIHDVKIKAHPEYFSKKFLIWYNFLISRECKNAKMIITVSEFSKSEIMKYYHVSADRITVIPNAWQHYKKIGYDKDALNKFGLKKGEYYFAMCSLEPNKNFKWIADAALNNPKQLFAIAGSINNSVFSNGLGFNAPSNMRLIGYVNDEEAKTLMRDCKAFLFPTIYEGFGIPPLEAFSCGCDRIVVSDTEVMHEIFGDTVYYIDPKKFNVDLQNIPKIVEVSKMKTLNKYSWVLSSRKLKVCIDNAINNMK